MKWVKRIAGVVVLAGLLFPLSTNAQQTALFGFERSWVDAQADFKAYNEIYFRNFDLRDIRVKIYDSDGEIRQDRISAEAMQQIGLAIFRNFSEQMDGVIAVNMEDLEIKDLKDKKFLVVDLKLSGSYEREDDRLLMKMIKGSATPPLAITIEGKILDSATEKEVVTFSDQKDIAQISDTPFENASDLEEFSILMSQWAGHLRDFLSKKRK